jgi:PhnB protein
METLKKKQRAGVQPIPDGFHTVTPFLIVDGAERLIEFLESAFDGELTDKFMTPDNRIMHATVTIGNSRIMLSDTMDGMQPQLGMLFLYVEDVDATFKDSLSAGGTLLREVRDEFYGDRAGAVKDEWGNTWWVATHTEDVSEPELKRRAKEAAKEPHPST